MLEITKRADDRVEPFCPHFGVCGGCKWQMLPYAKQLEYKEMEAVQNLKRIGGVEDFALLPIVGAADTVAYRNKLEFTASNKRYLTNEEINTAETLQQQDAIGFHVPRIFDKVIDIHICYLMEDVNNRIRNNIREIARDNGLLFTTLGCTAAG